MNTLRQNTSLESAKQSNDGVARSGSPDRGVAFRGADRGSHGAEGRKWAAEQVAMIRRRVQLARALRDVQRLAAESAEHHGRAASPATVPAHVLPLPPEDHFEEPERWDGMA